MRPAPAPPVLAAVSINETPSNEMSVLAARIEELAKQISELKHTTNRRPNRPRSASRNRNAHTQNSLNDAAKVDRICWYH